MTQVSADSRTAPKLREVVRLDMMEGVGKVLALLAVLLPVAGALSRAAGFAASGLGRALELAWRLPAADLLARGVISLLPVGLAAVFWPTFRSTMRIRADREAELRAWLKKFGRTSTDGRMADLDEEKRAEAKEELERIFASSASRYVFGKIAWRFIRRLDHKGMQALEVARFCFWTGVYSAIIVFVPAFPVAVIVLISFWLVSRPFDRALFGKGSPRLAGLLPGVVGAALVLAIGVGANAGDLGTLRNYTFETSAEAPANGTYWTVAEDETFVYLYACSRVSAPDVVAVRKDAISSIRLPEKPPAIRPSLWEILFEGRQFVIGLDPC